MTDPICHELRGWPSGGTDHLAEELARCLANNMAVHQRPNSIEGSVAKNTGTMALAGMLRANTTLRKLRLGSQAAATSTGVSF